MHEASLIHIRIRIRQARPASVATGRRRNNRQLLALVVAQSEVGLPKKTFILMRHHVGLNLAHEVHRHDHRNQQRGAAEIEGDVEAKVQELRHKAHEHKINGTAQSEAQKHLVDVASRLIPRADPRDERTALFRFSAVSFGLKTNAV